MEYFGVFQRLFGHLVLISFRSYDGILTGTGQGLFGFSFITSNGRFFLLRPALHKGNQAREKLPQVFPIYEYNKSSEQRTDRKPNLSQGEDPSGSGKGLRYSSGCLILRD